MLLILGGFWTCLLKFSELLRYQVVTYLINKFVYKFMLHLQILEFEYTVILSCVLATL